MFRTSSISLKDVILVALPNVNTLLVVILSKTQWHITTEVTQLSEICERIAICGVLVLGAVLISSMMLT